MTFASRAIAIALCLSAACAGKTSPATERSKIDPSDLFPMREGNAWSYDVDTGEPKTTLAITRVESFDGRIAVLRTGRKLIRYEVLAEGIRVPPGDAWLLRAPLEEGAIWPSRAGREARLVSTGVRLETPAGTFEGCFEVLETGGELELEVRTVYCPRVGPVALDSTMRSKLSDRVVTVSGRLRGYDVSPPSSPTP